MGVGRCQCRSTQTVDFVNNLSVEALLNRMSGKERAYEADLVECERDKSSS